MKLPGKLGAGIVVLLLVASLLLAMPVPLWRTGETSMPALDLISGAAFPQLPNRVWIDTDAACGTGSHRDPDDCLALLALLADPHINVVGVSTVFGNASAEVTERVTTALVEQINVHRSAPVSVFGGSSKPLRDSAISPAPPAHLGIKTALTQGPLTFVALGPLTNLAAAITDAPHLKPNLAGVIAVMGRRPGHLFHPTEGASVSAMLFGHGPVFTDLNVGSDPQAVARVIGWQRPLVLLPYEAAREVEMREHSLAELAARGAADKWVVERSKEWLEFWRREVGREGFYPFDLMAAAFVIDPGQFRCARVRVLVGNDPLFGALQRAPALLVADGLPLAKNGEPTGEAVYCADLVGDLQRPWHVPRSGER
jgi:purine nucleosidase